MEILFENRYVPTKEMVRELCLHTKLLSPRALLLYAVCVYYLIRTICVLIFGGQLLPIFPILAAYFLVMHFVDHHRTVKELLKQPVQQRIVVTEQGIAMDGYPSVITRSQIRRVRHTKNLILVSLKNRQLLMLPWRTFTIGDPADFLLFMIANGFQIH